MYLTPTTPQPTYLTPTTPQQELEVTLAEYLVEADQFEKARQVFADGIAIRTKRFGSDSHLQVALAELRFGNFLLERDEHKQAEELSLRAYEKLHDNPTARTATVERAVLQLVKLYAAWQKPAEAEKWQTRLDQLMSTEEK